MNLPDTKLRPFVRRVRILTGLKWMFMGCLVGGCLSLLWVGLDWARVFYASWASLGVLVLVCTLAGAVIGVVLPISKRALAKSIDHRAGLKDRLDTASEIHVDSPISALVQNDALNSLETVKASQIYPLRFGRLQIVALATCAVAASVFLLGNSPLLRGPKSAAEKEELKQFGEAVKRVANPLERAVESQPVPEGRKKLASDMKWLARELQEGKINKEETLRKVNELASKAEEKAKDDGDKAAKATEKAETALSKYTKMQLEDKGVDTAEFDMARLSPSEQQTLDRMIEDKGFQQNQSKFSDKQLSELGLDRSTEKLAQMTPEQREQLRQEVARQQADLQKELDRLDKLPDAERKALEQKMSELRQQQQELNKIAEKLKLSDETMKALQELMQSQEMKDLQEALQKMQQQAQKMKSQGQAPTKEELEQQIKQLEELAKKIKDPQFRDQFLKAMKEAAKQLKEGQMSAQAMQQMMSAMNTSMGFSPMNNGSPEPTQDDAFADTGKVNTSEHEMETKGRGLPTSVTGQWKEGQGEQWSVTVKAPTQVGNRTSVPYQSVLPQYKRAAEKAMSGGKIPKNQEKRVKEYFESLAGGKKR